MLISRRCAMSFAAMSALFQGCFVEAGASAADSTVEPAVAGAVSAPPPATAAPASNSDEGLPPNCYPDVFYEVGDQWVLVPGYCASRQFERPTIGDPDPMLPAPDVSEEP